MAIRFKPYQQTPISKTYQSTLGRWLTRQQESQTQFRQAAEPLGEAKGMYAPGGTYGAGQRVIIEEEARKARAKALSGYVASGMSSGTNVAGMQTRVAGDVTRAKLGVEDVRTERLTDILTRLSGLRATAAGQKGAAVDPTYAPYMGSLTSQAASQLGFMGQRQGIKAAGKRQSASIAAQQGMFAQSLASKEKMFAQTLAQKREEGKFNIPRLHL